jgi:hypothetical protein
VSKGIHSGWVEDVNTLHFNICGRGVQFYPYDLRQKESDTKVQELLSADVPGKHTALYSFSMKMKSHILATSPSFSNVVDS